MVVHVSVTKLSTPKEDLSNGMNRHILENQCPRRDPGVSNGERQGPTKAEDAREILERTAACD